MSTEAKQSLPRNALVIDDDESIGTLVKQILEDAGVENVRTFDNSVTAWEVAKDELFDFIVLDWKMPEITGAALLNRFRQHPKYYKVPIVISSGFLGKDDMALLGEFFLVSKFEKPVQKGSFLRKVAELNSEGQWFQSKEEQFIEIFSNLKNNDSVNTLKNLEKMLNETKRPVPLGICAVRILCSYRKYKEAEKVLRLILEKAPDSVFTLHELGKVLLINKSYDEAQKTLMLAYKKSPRNLERLNMLGNVSLQKMEMDEATTFFNKALDLDATDPLALKGQTVTENISQFMQQDGMDKVPQNFASLLNAVGISFVKGNDFEKGIEHYKSALPYLQDADLKARVAFNLGLGYLRSQRPAEAMQWLQKSAELSVTFTKAKELIPKVSSILARTKGGKGANLSEVETGLSIGEHESIIPADHDHPELEVLGHDPDSVHKADEATASPLPMPDGESLLQPDAGGDPANSEEPQSPDEENPDEKPKDPTNEPLI